MSSAFACRCCHLMTISSFVQFRMFYLPISFEDICLLHYPLFNTGVKPSLAGGQKSMDVRYLRNRC
jgi:hypothetical protein